MFFLVDCPVLDDPDNGTVNCTLGDDGVSSYEDTCNYTCDPGYELSGNNQRICLSNGRWSDDDVVHNCIGTYEPFYIWCYECITTDACVCYIITLYCRCVCVRAHACARI